MPDRQQDVLSGVHLLAEQRIELSLRPCLTKKLGEMMTTPNRQPVMPFSISRRMLWPTLIFCSSNHTETPRASRASLSGRAMSSLSSLAWERNTSLMGGTRAGGPAGVWSARLDSEKTSPSR